MSNWSLSHMSPRGDRYGSRSYDRDDLSSSRGTISVLETSNSAYVGGTSASTVRSSRRASAARRKQLQAIDASRVAHVGSTNPKLMQMAHEEEKLRTSCRLGDAAVSTSEMVDFLQELVEVGGQLIVQGEFAAAEIAANRAELLSRGGSAYFNSNGSVDPSVANKSFKNLRQKHSDEDWIVLCQYGPTSHSATTELCERLTTIRARALSTAAFAAKSQKRFHDARAALLDSVDIQGDKPHVLLNLLIVVSNNFFDDPSDFAAYEESLAISGQLIESIGENLDYHTSPEVVEQLVNGPVDQRLQLVEERKNIAQMLVSAMVTRYTVVSSRLFSDAERHHHNVRRDELSPRAQRIRSRELLKRSLDREYVATRITLELYEAHRLASQELGTSAAEFEQCCEAIEEWVSFMSAHELDDGHDGMTEQRNSSRKSRRRSQNVDPDEALDFDDLWRSEIRRARRTASQNTVLSGGPGYPSLQQLYRRSPYHLAAPLLLGAALLKMEEEQLEEQEDFNEMAPRDELKNVEETPETSFLAAAVEHLTSHQSMQASRSLSFESAQPLPQTPIPIPSEKSDNRVGPASTYVSPNPNGVFNNNHTRATESSPSLQPSAAHSSMTAAFSDLSPGRSAQFKAATHSPYQAGSVIAPPPLARTVEANPPPGFGGTQHQRSVSPAVGSSGVVPPIVPQIVMGSPPQQPTTPRGKSSGIVASPRPIQRPPR